MNPVMTNSGYYDKKIADPELFVITEYDCIWFLN